MEDGGNTAEGKPCQKDLLLHSANSTKFHDRAVTNNIGIHRPAGKGNGWAGQDLHCRFNELRYAKSTGNTKDNSCVDPAPKELAFKMVQCIAVKVMNGPLSRNGDCIYQVVFSRVLIVSTEEPIPI